jgi:hypothetical protein
LENEAELKQFVQFYLGEWLIKVRLNFPRDEVDLIFTLPKPINFLRVDDLQTVYTGECECLIYSLFLNYTNKVYLSIKI